MTHKEFTTEEVLNAATKRFLSKRCDETNEIEELNLCQKRAAAYETKSIILDYSKLIAEIEKIRRIYRDIISIFLVAYRPYRHIWE